METRPASKHHGQPLEHHIGLRVVEYGQSRHNHRKLTTLRAGQRRELRSGNLLGRGSDPEKKHHTKAESP
jgi:hypothetical protein